MHIQQSSRNLFQARAVSLMARNRQRHMTEAYAAMIVYHRLSRMKPGQFALYLEVTILSGTCLPPETWYILAFAQS